jgi:hypothetical protein
VTHPWPERRVCTTGKSLARLQVFRVFARIQKRHFPLLGRASQPLRILSVNFLNLGRLSVRRDNPKFNNQIYDRRRSDYSFPNYCEIINKEDGRKNK